MDDPHRKRPPLVEDPVFQASLNDLDRGLDATPDANLQPSRNVRPRQPPAAPPPPTAATPLPEPFAFTPQPSIDPSRQRPLLDLFPSSALSSERPPGPILGTAVGPQLPGGASERVRLRAEPRPEPGPLTCETFYGLREPPFDQSTDPRFFFHSTAHERVASDLLEGIRRRRGVAVLTGDHGAGKTTLCRAIARDLDRSTIRSIVLAPAVDVTQLLKIVLVDWGVMSRDDLARAPHLSRGELLGALGSFCESLAPLQANALVLLDEADRQPPEVVAELGALATSGAGAGVLTLVLVGHTSLIRSLDAPALRTVGAAAPLRCELGPLAADEIGGYVMHRLAVAGTSPRVAFDEAALQRIFDLSRGVPGIVNMLCDRALVGAFQRSASTIDLPMADTAAASLDLAAPPGEWQSMARAAIAAGTLVALMLAGAAGALWVFRDAVSRTIASWQDVPPAPRPPALRQIAPLAPPPPPQ